MILCALLKLYKHCFGSLYVLHLINSMKVHKFIYQMWCLGGYLVTVRKEANQVHSYVTNIEFSNEIWFCLIVISCTISLFIWYLPLILWLGMALVTKFIMSKRRKRWYCLSSSFHISSGIYFEIKPSSYLYNSSLI